MLQWASIHHMGYKWFWTMDISSIKIKIFFSLLFTTFYFFFFIIGLWICFDLQYSRVFLPFLLPVTYVVFLTLALLGSIDSANFERFYWQKPCDRNIFCPVLQRSATLARKLTSCFQELFFQKVSQFHLCNKAVSKETAQNYNLVYWLFPRW